MHCVEKVLADLRVEYKGMISMISKLNASMIKETADIINLHDNIAEKALQLEDNNETRRLLSNENVSPMALAPEDNSSRRIRFAFEL